MFENEFSQRLAMLRTQKGVSARDMSLSIGQNAGYINNIENGKALPSMASFLFICEYLNITPSEFFDVDTKQPELIRNITQNLNKLSEKQLQSIAVIVEDLASK